MAGDRLNKFSFPTHCFIVLIYLLYPAFVQFQYYCLLLFSPAERVSYSGGV